MSRPKAHYSLHVKNHLTGNHLKVEMIDLPFADGRRFRVRVNGRVVSVRTWQGTESPPPPGSRRSGHGLNAAVVPFLPLTLATMHKLASFRRDINEQA